MRHKHTPIVIGQRIGRWTVQRKTARREDGQGQWLCRCDCGTERVTTTGNLHSGDSNSCGCLRNERTRKGIKAALTTHGMSHSVEYRAWMMMRSRCSNRNIQAWQHYGARGIKVCPEWEVSFVAFYEYMGPRPSDRHSIDRIDVDGHYEPGNVRWAVPIQQRANQRRARK